MEKQGYLITREMVYGTETPEIQDGWEDTGEFRPPEPYDTYIPIGGGCDSITKPGWRSTEPRIILRKKSLRKVVFTSAGRRPPKRGEFMECETGEIVKACSDHSFPADILIREEVFE